MYILHTWHGTCHVLMTTPGLCSAQKYVISPFLFPPGAAGGPQCYSVAGILIRKLQHTPLPGQPTHSPHCGDTTLPSYQQEEYPTSTLCTYSLQTIESTVYRRDPLPGCRWPAIILASWRCLVTSGLAWPRLNPAQLTVWVCSISISSSRGGG